MGTRCQVRAEPRKVWGWHVVGGGIHSLGVVARGGTQHAAGQKASHPLRLS